MIYVIKAAYSFLLPPGIFIVLLLFLSYRQYRSTQRLASFPLLLAVSLYLISTPYISDILIKSLEDRYHPPAQVQGDVLVMLGGGATAGTPDIGGVGQLSGSAANRLLTAVRLYNKTHLPILVSGGQVFSDSSNEASIARRQLMELGVPKNKIIVEDKSRNTEENAKYVKELLEEHHYKEPILVTSAFHMERSVGNFSKVGVPVIPYPTDYRSSLSTAFYVNKMVPSANALSNVSTALKEYIGIVALAF